VDFIVNNKYGPIDLLQFRCGDDNHLYCFSTSEKVPKVGRLGIFCVKRNLWLGWKTNAPKAVVKSNYMHISD
jgi:hypothetical protein